jgi:hypothetical protein
MFVRPGCLYGSTVRRWMFQKSIPRMFVRVGRGSPPPKRPTRTNISRPPFFGGGATPGARSGGGAHFLVFPAENGDGKAYPYKPFFRQWTRTNIWSPDPKRPTRTNICRVSPSKHFAVQTSAAGKCCPLLAAAGAPPDVWTANVCTGLIRAEEGRCWDRAMFVRVVPTDPYKLFLFWRSSRPVQTSGPIPRGKHLAEKHTRTNIQVQTFFGTENVCTGLPLGGAVDPYKHPPGNGPESLTRTNISGPKSGPERSECLYGSTTRMFVRVM